MPNVRLMPRTTRVRRLRRRHLRRGRARQRPSAGAAAASAAPAAVADRRKTRRSGRRRDRAADRVRRQRPPGRHAGVRGAHLRQSLRRRSPADAWPCSPTTTTAGAPPRPRRATASNVAAVIDTRRRSPRAAGALAGNARIRGRRVDGDNGGARCCVEITVPHATARQTIACGYARDVRRLESRRRPHLPPWRAAGLERGHRGLRSRRIRRQGMMVAGAANGDDVARRVPCRRAKRAGAPRRDAGLHGRGRRAAAGGRRDLRRHAALARRRRTSQQGIRRFPERCHRRGHRARRARGISLGRASQALHDARHGDRPGQDRQRHRPRDHGGAHRARRSPRPARRPFARPTRRSRSAPSPGIIAARHFGRSA